MDMLYMLGCAGPCGEDRVAFATPEPNQACWDCTPHICTPEMPGDDWCDLCGKDI